MTTTPSTLSPAASSVYNFIIVEEDPPAPAERVLAGRALATAAFLSAAARRRIVVLGPPGALPLAEGVEGRPAGELERSTSD